MIVKSRNPKNPEGSVLLFAFIVMLLMGLMSVAIFLNTRTELSISHNTAMGRDAFTKADAAGRVAIQLARVLVTSGTGNPEQYIPESLKGPFEVEINSALTQTFNDSNMVTLAGENTEQDILNRQLAAMAVKQPHVIIKYNGEVVGTAAVAIGYLKPAPGGSMGGGGGGGEGAGTPASQDVAITVVATGRVAGGAGDGATNFFDGNAKAPHSVISTIFKDSVR